MITAKIQKIGLRIAAVALAAVMAAAQAPEIVQAVGTLEQARQDFKARRFADAVTGLRSLVAAEPGNYEARYWLVRSLIKDKRARDAWVEAEAAVKRAPNEAYAQLALGDACFRNGAFERAALAYRAALQIDPKLARAYLGFGLIHASEGRRKSAMTVLRRAFELDPNDTDIVHALAEALPECPEEIQLWERYAREATDLDAEELANVQSWVLLRKSRPGPTKLVTPDGKTSFVVSLKRAFVPNDRTKRTDLYVEVRINGGKPRKLLLDTGASGIILVEKDALKDGVKAVSEIQISGIGDEGTRAGSAGWAGTVEIGDIRLENYPVEMARQSGSIVFDYGDGIIGTNVFYQFRLSIDPANQTLALEKLPELPDDGISSYDAPLNPPAGFFPMRVFGTKIVADGLIADKEKGCLLLDTGGWGSLLNEETARLVASVGGTGVVIRGVSGKVKKLFEADNVAILFGGIRQKNQSLLVLDMRELSDDIGVELMGLVGMTLLQHVVVTIDYRDCLIRLTPTPTGLRR